MPNTREKMIELAEVIDSYFGCDAAYFDVDKFTLAKRIMEAGWTKQEWISVKDRLPEEDGKYLMCKDLWGKSYISVVWFAKDGRKVSRYDFENRWKNVWYEYDSEYGNIILDNVTHWMPLPQPPKGETIYCKDCEHLMFSDCYGECAKGYKGIVQPNDTCEHARKKPPKGE